jgi:hypothetical protein
MAYSVTWRARAIGVRIALGASRSTVLSMVVKQAPGLVAAGLGLGPAATVAADRLLQSTLFGISSLNPAVQGLPGLLVALTRLLAAYLFCAPGSGYGAHGGAAVRMRLTACTIWATQEMPQEGTAIRQEHP